MAVTLPFKVIKFALKLLADKKRLRFIEACKEPEKAQEFVKQKILALSTSPFPAEIRDYHYYSSLKHLTHSPVTFYETTSGSTGAKKSIPYTKELLDSFQNMFLLWAHDLVFHSSLNLESGKFFMSVSPVIGEKNNDDRKYLSPALNILLSPFLSSDPSSHHGVTASDFFLKISKDLIRSRDLEIISIWSPTYLLSLLDFMNSHREELGIGNKSWKEIWPRLRLISCWTHAQAERTANLLREIFPDVRIQSKGLLLTEAPVTIPWSEAGGNIPLLNETYLEFLKDGTLYKLHELRPGEKYTVITSQANGYLRYNTTDEVLVTGMYFKTPVLEFIGRTGISSDLAGEKLSEGLLQDLYKDISETFYLIPDLKQALPGYILLTEKDSHAWEDKLQTIYHYNLARKLNQLRPLEVRKTTRLKERYLEFCQSEGMNLGDIKEKILFSNLIQAEKFLAWIEKKPQSSR